MNTLIKLLTCALLAIKPWFENKLSQHSSVGNPYFFETSLFPWANALEDQTHAIQQELTQFLEKRHELPNFSDISSIQRMLVDTDDWKTVFLYAYGVSSPQICAHCPNTVKALANIPGMYTAMFSILAPYTHIKRHIGPYSGVLRAHLALTVPTQKEHCYIRVGSDIRHWVEGQLMIFDDTFDHEVHNNTNELRVVLFIDFERPLPLVIQWLNRAFIKIYQHSPFLKEGIDNNTAWVSQFYKKERIANP